MRPNERMQIEQCPVGDKLVTIIRRIEPDGSEAVQVAGEYDPVNLELQEEPGQETVLTERIR